MSIKARSKPDASLMSVCLAFSFFSPPSLPPFVQSCRPPECHRCCRGLYKACRHAFIGDRNVGRQRIPQCSAGAISHAQRLPRKVCRGICKCVCVLVFSREGVSRSSAYALACLLVMHLSQEILQSVGYYDVELDTCKPSPCWTTPSDTSIVSCGEDIVNHQASLKSVHTITIADCLDQADGSTTLASTGGDVSQCEMSGAYGDSFAYLSCGALGEFVCSL